MEKDLLDLSGEDEEDYWLLKNTPKKGVTSFPGGLSGGGKSCLDSSRPQIPRSNPTVHTRPPFSPIGRVTGNNGVEQPSPSVDTENVGKENTSGNRFELPKLSVERQQMKKKKKITGFNLRKSLAWDRAFSTEEGVLDPVELSKITGNACQAGGELLPAIHEEFRESVSASKCTSVSPGLQALEEKLFSDLPVNSKKRGKKIMSGVMPKYASPSKVQSSSKKVTPLPDLRSGSKRSGCPRPPPSSSPANVHTKKPVNRELSVSKVSTTKSDPLTVSNIMKSTAQSPSKVKQSHPTRSKNPQKSIGSINSAKNTSSIKGKTKSSLASYSSIPKPSLKQVRRNVVSKTSEIPSVSNLQHATVGKSSVGPMTTSDVHMRGHASHITDSNVVTMGTSLAQSHFRRVGNTQSTVSQLGKPSGLRVPSPSIGYFSQADSQPSHSAGDRHSQISRSDVCSTSRVSSVPALKKPQVAENVRVNLKAATRNTGSSGSAAGFSSQYVLSSSSQEMENADLKSTGEVESKVSSSSLSSRINEILQRPVIIQGDTGKLPLDGVTVCTSEKICTGECEESQSNSKLASSGCKGSVKEGNMIDENRDKKRKSCGSEEEYCASPMKHGPIFKDSMDSPMQCPFGGELKINNYSHLKVSNPGEEGVCTTGTEDFDTLDIHGQSPNECIRVRKDDEVSPCLSKEKQDALIVYQSNKSVTKQSEVLDSFTAETASGLFASTKSDADDISSENQLGNTDSVSIPLGPAEASDSVQSPRNHLEENATSNSVLCDHNMGCDGHAASETEKIIEENDITDTNCEADFIGTFPDCKDWFRESKEQHFSCLSVLEDSHMVDVLTPNGRADKDSGPAMQIDYLKGPPFVEQNMEQVISSSAEVRMENKPLEVSHESFSEQRTSEKHMQSNGSNVPYTSDVNVDQLGTSDGCSPAKDVPGAVFSNTSAQLEDNSDLEDMDLVTESDYSDKEPDDNLEMKEVDPATESELINDLDEFFVKGSLNQDQPGETKALLNESVSSSASLYGDPEHLNEDTKLSRISEGMLKEDSSPGRIEHNYIREAKIQTDTEKDFSVQVTDQELSPHEEEKVQVVMISHDPVAFATTEEESRTPISVNEAFSLRDDMQPNESNLPTDNILIPESNGVHASKDKTILLDGKKPDPIVVKHPDVIPFSDEWLAAIEAAGEEILTMKSGRVQHSPTEKSVPELGPWSPVKKKNNQGVGPFDCTKYTNKGLPPPALD